MEIKSIGWKAFLEYFLDSFEQGQHISIVAKNGTGKTHLTFKLMDAFRKAGMYEVFLWSKPKDKEIQDYFLAKRNIKILKDSNYPFQKFPTQLIAIKPEAKNLNSLRTDQQYIFSEVLNKVWNIGYYQLIIDELRYVSNTLGLASEIQILLLQARSSKVSLILLSQRPRWVPVETWTEARYQFIGVVNSLDDRKVIASYLDKELLTELSKIPIYYFLFTDIITKEYYLVKAPK